MSSKIEISKIRNRLSSLENNKSLDIFSASVADKIEVTDAAVGALASSLFATSGSLKNKSDALSASLSTLIEVTLPSDRASTKEKADALSASLSTLIEITLPSDRSSTEQKRQELSSSLKGLIEQNDTTVKNRINSLDGQVLTINNFTSSTNTNINSLNTFRTSNVDKLSSLAATKEQEDSYASSSVGTAGSVVGIIKPSLYTSLFLWDINKPPDNYWAYSVTYPTGAKPFTIKSFSYMGTSQGTKYWNLEEAISYSKREYNINSGRFGYDANNTMIKNADGSASIIKDSELILKAGQITIQKGFENTASPAAVIIGETAEANGTGKNQGQLFIRDEDNADSGLQIGYRYQQGVAEYGRIQAINSVGATNLYLNPAGGSVVINRLGNHNLTDGTIELNYYGTGNRNTFIDFHSDDSYGYPGINPATVYNGDYSGRIIRFSGENGIMQIENKGNGGIRNSVINGAGNIFDWYLGGTKLMHLSSTGQLRTTEINIEADRIELAARDSDTADLALNYLGYNGGTTRFRNVKIYDGKQSTIALFEGSSKKAYKTGGGFWDTLSDIRVKENIRNYTKGLEYINKINPVIFDYNGKAGFPSSKDNISIVAQEIIDIIPECVSKYKAKLNENDTEDTEIYSFNPNSLFYIMVNSIKELSLENEYLKKKLEEKDKQLEDILLRLSALENKNV